MNNHIRLQIFFLLLCFNMTVFTADAFDASDMDIHGFLSQGYLQTDHNNFLAKTEDGTLQFNEFGLNFTTRLSDKLTAGIQFFGRDMGTVGNDEIRVDWALMNYKWKDWAGLKVGKMKVVYGLYNETREIDMLRTSILLPQSVYVESYRDSTASIKGIGLYGSLPIESIGDFSYEFQFGVAPFLEGDGVSQTMENKQSRYNLKIENIDSRNAFAYGITWDTPLQCLKFRYSSIEVNNLESSGRVSITIPADTNNDGIISPGEGIPVTDFKAEAPLVRFNILSGEFFVKNFILKAEYMEMDNRQVFQIGPVTSMQNTPFMGWYVAGSYRLNEIITIGLSYSEFYPNSNDKSGDTQLAIGRKDFQGWQKTYTVSTKFDVNRFWIFKFETSYNDGFGAMQPVYNDPAKLEPYWWLFAAKATVSF